MRIHNLLLAARAAALAMLLSAMAMVVPAQACGCGGYIPHDGQASVSQEQALLRWDGQTEDILMSLGVLGRSSEAAVILPVPSQAKATLSQAGVWDELNQMTRPLEKHEKRNVLPLPLMGAGACAGYPFHPAAFLADTGVGGSLTVIVVHPVQHWERHHLP